MYFSETKKKGLKIDEQMPKPKPSSPSFTQSKFSASEKRARVFFNFFDEGAIVKVVTFAKKWQR